MLNANESFDLLCNWIFCQDPRDAEDAVKALHRTELCGMRATVKMAREKEEEREQARDRMLREEMAKRKRRLEAEQAKILSRVATKILGRHEFKWTRLKIERRELTQKFQHSMSVSFRGSLKFWVNLRLSIYGTLSASCGGLYKESIDGQKVDTKSWNQYQATLPLNLRRSFVATLAIIIC